jgi:hypothetical protein
MSRSLSLGGDDPRNRRAPQEALTDLDLKLPLRLNQQGQLTIDLSGALFVSPDGSIAINTSNGITTAPGSPLSIQLSIDDDSLEITPDKKVRARPRFSQIKVDRRDVREVTGRNLAEVIDTETELIKRKGAVNGYCELDSSAMVPAARVPFSALPATVQLAFVNDTTYNQNVVRFSNDGSGSSVNYVEFVNAATGVDPQVKVAGSNTNIDLDLYAKGTGVVRANGSQVETRASKDAVNGYCGLDSGALVSPISLGTGVVSGQEFLRGDQTYVLDARAVEAYQHSGSGGAGAVYYIANCVQMTALNTGAPSANVMRAMPFIAPARGGTITELAFNVTTGAVGDYRIGIYTNTADDELYPDMLLLDTGSISTATTGVKTASAALALDAGRLYWMVVVGDAAPTIRTITVNNCSDILGYSTAMGTAGNVGISLAFTYGALPDPFGAGGSYITAAPIPAIAYKI